MILVAEDDPTTMLLVRIFLKPHFNSIIEAKNGIQLVQNYIDKQRDNLIILTDVMMPVMNGLEAAKIIRQYNRPVYIIATTALEQTSRVVDTKGQYIPWSVCDHYVRKPFKQEELVAAIYAGKAKFQK